MNDEQKYRDFWEKNEAIFQLVNHHQEMIEKAGSVSKFEDISFNIFFWVSSIFSTVFAFTGTQVWKYLTIPAVLFISYQLINYLEKKTERQRAQALKEQKASYQLIKKQLYNTENLGQILPYLKAESEKKIGDDTVFTLLSFPEVFDGFVFSIAKKDMSDEQLEQFIRANCCILEQLEYKNKKSQAKQKKLERQEMREKEVNKILQQIQPVILDKQLFKKNEPIEDEQKNQRYLQML